MNAFSCPCSKQTIKQTYPLSKKTVFHATFDWIVKCARILGPVWYFTAAYAVCIFSQWAFFITFSHNPKTSNFTWVFRFFFQAWRIDKTGNLLPKLFWPTVRKNCYSDREKLLKFETESRVFSKSLRSLEQFIQAVKGQNNFW